MDHLGVCKVVKATNYLIKKINAKICRCAHELFIFTLVSDQYRCRVDHLVVSKVVNTNV